MFRLSRMAAAAIIILFFVSCAGTNFVRPESGSLSLNRTTYQDIINQFGKPYLEGTKLKNENMIKTITYAYSSVGGTALYEGVAPARAIAFHFLDDVLVGYEFTSSFKADNSDFDESKITLIKKGVTTRHEVVTLLGEPEGIYTYPLIGGRDDEALVYMYNHFKRYKIYQKVLIVSMNEDTVADLDFMTSGNK
jgi:hypothetical protein